MKIFNEEELDNLLVETREELKLQLDPIIDQIVLVKMKHEILPLEQHNDPERQKEFKALMSYLVNLIHQLIGYSPQEL